MARGKRIPRHERKWLIYDFIKRSSAAGVVVTRKDIADAFQMAKSAYLTDILRELLDEQLITEGWEPYPGVLQIACYFVAEALPPLNE